MNRRPMSESYPNTQAGQTNTSNSNSNNNPNSSSSANDQTSNSNSNSNGNQSQQQSQQQQQQQQPTTNQNNSNGSQIPQLMCATELTNLLLEFAFSVFVNKPEDIVDYAASYFTQLRGQRPGGQPIDPMATTSGGGAAAAATATSPSSAANYHASCATSGPGSKRASADSQRSSYSSGSVASTTYQNNNNQNDMTMNNNNNIQDNISEDDDFRSMPNSNNNNNNNVQPKIMTSFNRRKSVFAEHYDPANDPEEDENSRVVHGKTDEQRQRLAKSIKSIFIFRSVVDSQDVANILDAMFEVKVKAGDVVIKQGDDGDNFYVVERGKFQIYVTLDDGTRQIRGEYEDNGSFGELALMYNQPRAASVIALTDGSLWAMDRNTFRRIVLKSAFRKRKEYEALFEKVSVLQCLNNYERMNLCDALESRRFANGQRIINQGDQANGMYFIESGNVKIVKQLDDGRTLDVAILGKGDYFGELALINHKPRAASVYAMGDDVKLAFLDVKAFERLLGSCIERMEKNCAMYLSELAQAEARQNV